jgi:isopenicillin N synthase-like dioxygenase
MHFLDLTYKKEIISAVKSVIPQFFALPAAEKEKLSFLNSPHFLGYNALGSETTASKTDLREQFEFSNDLEDESTDPLSFQRLRGPSQWPSNGILPEFKQILTKYHNEVTALSYRFVRLVAETLGLPPKTFDVLFQGNPQHRVKVVRYPPTVNSDQGVGPHKDSSGWWTFLLQADDQEGLQVLNHSGEWISAPPIEGTFVVNIGQGFEVATSGRCPATTHRVVSPQNGKERYSVPFFQGIDLNVGADDLKNLVKGGKFDETHWRESTVETPFATGKYKWGENQIRTKIRFNHFFRY